MISPSATSQALLSCEWWAFFISLSATIFSKARVRNISLFCLLSCILVEQLNNDIHTCLSLFHLFLPAYFHENRTHPQNMETLAAIFDVSRDHSFEIIFHLFSTSQGSDTEMNTLYPSLESLLIEATQNNFNHCLLHWKISVQKFNDRWRCKQGWSRCSRLGSGHY